MGRFIFILIFLIAFSIRLYQFSFFEFKNDQFIAIQAAEQTKAAHYLITHGMSSGVGLDNPPGFYYLMGALTTLNHDPAWLTLVFFCINIIALILSLIYFYKTLPLNYAILSAVFLGLSPALTIYSSNIWAQTLLPLLMIIFHFHLYKLIKYERYCNFIILGLLAVLASQLHMSGFSLFPLLAIIALVYRKKIDLRTLLLTGLVVLVLFIPFFIYLFFQGGIVQFIAYGVSEHRPVPWDIFIRHLQMNSYDFFRYYFKELFSPTLINITGVFRWVLYPLSMTLSLFFLVGVVSYVRWLKDKRKLFDKDETEHPLAFQISGFVFLVITIEYLLFRAQAPIPMHYFIIFFLVYGLITGFGALQCWKYRLGKFIVILGALSTGILLVLTLVFLDRSGGHPVEYGISYKSLVMFKDEIKKLKKDNECFDLNVQYFGFGKFDRQAALSVLNKGNFCKSSDKVNPLVLKIRWNEKIAQYEHFLEY